MPRARSLKPQFFTDVDLLDCDPWVRLLFAGLWTIADREGRPIDRAKQIKLDIFPGDDLDVEAGLAELADRRFIIRYEIDGVRYIQIRTFTKHQNPHHKELSRNYPAPGQPGASLGSAPGLPRVNPADSGLREPDSVNRTPDPGLLTTDAEQGVHKGTDTHREGVQGEPLHPSNGHASEALLADARGIDSLSETTDDMPGGENDQSAGHKNPKPGKANKTDDPPPAPSRPARTERYVWSEHRTMRYEQIAHQLGVNANDPEGKTAWEEVIGTSLDPEHDPDWTLFETVKNSTRYRPQGDWTGMAHFLRSRLWEKDWVGKAGS